VVLAVLLVGCGGDDPTAPDPPVETGTISGYITIEGETDHSGIQVILQSTAGGAPAVIWAKASKPEPDFSLAGLGAAGVDTTTTDANGYFEFLEVAYGSYTIYASRGDAMVGFQTDVVVGSTEPTEIEEMTLTPTGSITGTVLLEGESDHSGVIVFVAGTSYAAYTDADGAYTIADVPVGTHTLMAARWGFDTTNIGDVEVTAGSSTNAGEVSLSRAAASAPYVVMTFPEQGAIATVPGTTAFPLEDYWEVYDLAIMIQFSDAMDWDSVKDALSISPVVDVDEDEFVVRSNALHILTSTSSWRGTPLMLNTAYSITIAAGASDIYGNQMSSPFTLGFTTGGLAIGTTDPEDGDTVIPGVPMIEIRPNAPLAEQYRLSNSTVTFSPEVTGTWEGDYSDNFEFELDIPLRSETEYQVTVDGIRDYFDNELPEPFVFSFTTGEVRLISISPADGQVEVDPKTELRLSFTAQMDENSLESDLIISPAIELHVGGWGWGYESRSYSLRAESGFWPAGAQVSVSVPAQVTDYFGVGIANPGDATFTIAPFRGIDSYPPDGALGISTTPYAISAEFNNRVDEDSITGALSISPVFGYDLDPGWDGSEIELRPTDALAPSTTYTITFSTALVTDTGAALEAPYTFSFTTRDE
jgi:hypothetical protein